MPCKNCPHAEGSHNEQGCTTCAICGSRGMICGHMDTQPDAVCRCGGYEEGGV